MTEEELEKEAEKNISNLKNNAIKISGKPFQITEGDYIQGYLDGAEPREKRIEELETRCMELKEELKDANEKVVHLSCNQNKDLKRNITKATKLLKEAQGYIENEDDELYDKIEQLLVVELIDKEEEDDEEELHWTDVEGDWWDDDVIAWCEIPKFEEAAE